MFIIVDGVVGVWTNLEDGSRHQVNRLGIGDFLGENAILMGEVRNATIVAQTEVCLYELHKNDLSPLLVQFPELAHILDQTLSRRTIQTANEHVQAQRRAKNSNLSSPFLQKIKRLFLKRSI
jgi:CRP-like cAMP-binding protein